VRQKLLDLAKSATEIVEKNNFSYYWQADGYKFNNVNLARWYEKEFGSWATFVARDHSKFQQALQNKTIDMSCNYDLDFVKQLRQTYDYIRLHFSGGYDSAAVFKQFADNNIYLDETVTILHPEEFPKCRQEILSNSQPWLKKYSQIVDKTTIVEMTHKKLLEQWSDEYACFSITTAEFMPIPMGICMLENFEYEEYENSCNIKCIDKPQLVYYNNRWYVTALDSSVGSHIGRPNTIYFWLDPRNVKGLIKHARLYRDFVVETHAPKKHLEFYKFWSQDELNYVIERPEIYNADQKLTKTEKNYEEKFGFLLQNRYDIPAKYFKAIDKFIEIFPETAESFDEYNKHGKFAWLIDIDNLEIYTQRELIPDGFKPPSRL